MVLGIKGNAVSIIITALLLLLLLLLLLGLLRRSFRHTFKGSFLAGDSYKFSEVQKVLPPVIVQDIQSTDEGALYHDVVAVVLGKNAVVFDVATVYCTCLLCLLNTASEDFACRAKGLTLLLRIGVSLEIRAEETLCEHFELEIFFSAFQG